MKNFILITGGAGGIGRSLAYKLKKLDLYPVIAFKTSEEQASEIIKNTGGYAFHLDLSDESSILNFLEELERINIKGVVLAASSSLELKSYSKVEAADLRHHFETTIVGHHLLLRVIIKEHFKKNKSGIIVGLLSEAMGSDMKAGMSLMSDYIVSKYALKGLLSAIKKEHDWLEVETISPSFTDTNMLKSAFDERFIDLLRDQNKIEHPDTVAMKIIKLLE